MKISISIGSAYYNGEDWDDLVDYTQEADKLGVDQAWSAEAWGMDAIVPLAYLAAKTEKIKLGTGILQISSRVPSMMAMTAQSLDTVSKGRFILGLGVSGPQVVEGLHGASFAKPLSRLRECVEILRIALAGEKIAFEGEHYLLPRPGGEGKAIRLSQPPRPELPIYLATLGPKSLQMTGELANGWLGTCFLPEHASVFLDDLSTGTKKAGRSLNDIDIQAGGYFEISDDVDGLINKLRPGMAFTLGAMGSAKTNFYNDAYCRAGYEDVAKEVQSLWVAGNRDEAIRQVPDELITMSNFIGTQSMVEERLNAFKAAGVNTLRISTGGSTWKERTAALEEAMDSISKAAT
ncbi:MAG: F420-dependent methylene-tetrahydromethanopterin reductase [Gammaproteobacteria bacterium]|jgi:F420-dependent oxidoreductase-like protein|nr:F420-dependent methylene-tetrahydromethanopterin reductase [Gammaproteobacteria bacterium]HAY50649.1 F420-dependent methylene-tetrahydromethanopterin reductase [Acidimicrobiaceae bacterium]|tara:strand:+ start:405 stop:1451 length:1047 start_codon:yes stop_codon:yes gene_type:complete